MKKVISIVLLFICFVTVFKTKTFSHCGYRYYDYPNIVSAYWDYTTAKWNVDGYASKYEVALYKDGYRIVTRTTYSRSYNFNYYMVGKNSDYWFEVRPYDEYSGWGKWISSNRLYSYSNDWCSKNYNYRYPGSSNPYDIAYPVNQGPPINNQTNNSNTVAPNVSSGNAGVSGVSVTVPSPQIVYDTDGIIPIGTLMQVNGECYFAYLNGVFARNTWLKSKGKWYYFDTTGTMIRGFYTINGSTYYLNVDGSMATGMTKIDGVVHYFDNNGIMIY